MARILYGVMGNTYGHVMRTQAIVERLMPEHEFLFVGGGRVPEALGAAGRGWHVLEVPVLRTVHQKGKVSVSRVIGQIAGRLVDTPRVLGGLAPRHRRFPARPRHLRPRIFPAPRVPPRRAARASRSTIRTSSRRAATRCPPGERLSWTLAMLNDYLLFDFTRHHLIVSFFHPPLRRRRRGRGDVDELLPPVLRPAVTRCPTRARASTSSFTRPARRSARCSNRCAQLNAARDRLRLRHRTRAPARATSCSNPTTTARSSKTSPAARTRWSTAGTTSSARRCTSASRCCVFPSRGCSSSSSTRGTSARWATGISRPTRGRARRCSRRSSASWTRYRAAIAAAGSFDGTARVVERVRNLVAGN